MALLKVEIVYFILPLLIITCYSGAEENSCSRLLLQALNENKNVTNDVTQINGTSHMNVTVLTLPCLDYLSDEMLTKQIVKEEFEKNNKSITRGNNQPSDTEENKITGTKN